MKEKLIQWQKNYQKLDKFHCKKETFFDTRLLTNVISHHTQTSCNSELLNSNKDESKKISILIQLARFIGIF